VTVADSSFSYSSLAGNAEEEQKYEKRLTKVTKEHNADARELLRLMGVPIVESPGEAEAQCSELVKGGVVYASATEDMDALTFGTPRLLRHLTSPASRKEPVLEVNLEEVLKGFNFSMDQFIDMCILCGCDYTTTIRGIGPTTAHKLIQQHGNMEGALKHLAKDDKHKVGEEFLPREAAELFKHPDVTPASEIKLEWKAPDVEGIIEFLVGKKGFNLERVQGALKRLQGARGKANQQRIEGFFFGKPAAKPAAATAASASAAAASDSSAAAAEGSPSASAAAAAAPAASSSSTPFIGHAPGIVFEKPNKRKEAPAGSTKKGAAAGALAKKQKTKDTKAASKKK